MIYIIGPFLRVSLKELCIIMMFAYIEDLMNRRIALLRANYLYKSFFAYKPESSIPQIDSSPAMHQTYRIPTQPQFP